MFLDLRNHQLKRVYELSAELRRNPEHMQLAQALTLNKDKPFLGLKGKHGLFASEQWWESVREGRIRTEIICGVIENTYFAGQDSRWGNEVNSFDLKLDDGSIFGYSICSEEKSDLKLFKPGAIVAIAFAHDELKYSSSGNAEYSRVLLEMAVSRQLD